jgi:hypothetical protein
LHSLRSIIRLAFALIERSTQRAARQPRIGGQAPKVRWKRNKGGLKRTIEEAAEIASKYGVEIPKDVIFHAAEPGELQGNIRELLFGIPFESAKGPEVAEHADGRIHWQDHYNKDGKIPFQINPEVLISDEAIVSVFHHEMYELSMLRHVFMLSPDQSMSATDYGIQVSTGRPGNFHDQAWSEADKIVLRMRKSGR